MNKKALHMEGLKELYCVKSIIWAVLRLFVLTFLFHAKEK